MPYTELHYRLVRVESFMAVLTGVDTEGFSLSQIRLAQADSLKGASLKTS